MILYVFAFRFHFFEGLFRKFVHECRNTAGRDGFKFFHGCGEFGAEDEDCVFVLKFTPVNLIRLDFQGRVLREFQIRVDRFKVFLNIIKYLVQFDEFFLMHCAIKVRGIPS